MMKPYVQLEKRCTSAPLVNRAAAMMVTDHVDMAYYMPSRMDRHLKICTSTAHLRIRITNMKTHYTLNINPDLTAHSSTEIKGAY